MERAQAEEPRDRTGRGGEQAAVVVPGHRARPRRTRCRRTATRSPASTDAPDHPPLAFAAVEEALAWYDDERGNIVAATRQAAAAGLHEIAWRLPPTLFPLFNRRSNWADCVTAHRIAADSARKAGDRLGEAWALSKLGFALARLRDPEAFGHLEQALAIRQELGDTQGEAQTAHRARRGLLSMHGPGADALRIHAARGEPAAADRARLAARDRAEQPRRGLLRSSASLTRPPSAISEACDICREIGGNGLGHALHNLGRVYLAPAPSRRGDRELHGGASHAPGLGGPDRRGARAQEPGRGARRDRRQAAARQSLAEALAIFEQIGEADGRRRRSPRCSRRAEPREAASNGALGVMLTSLHRYSRLATVTKLATCACTSIPFCWGMTRSSGIMCDYRTAERTRRRVAFRDAAPETMAGHDGPGDDGDPETMLPETPWRRRRCVPGTMAPDTMVRTP